MPGPGRSPCTEFQTWRISNVYTAARTTTDRHDARISCPSIPRGTCTRRYSGTAWCTHMQGPLASPCTEGRAPDPLVSCTAEIYPRTSCPSSPGDIATRPVCTAAWSCSRNWGPVWSPCTLQSQQSRSVRMPAASPAGLAVSYTASTAYLGDEAGCAH